MQQRLATRVATRVATGLVLLAVVACSGSDHGTGVVTPPNGSGNVSLKLTPVVTGLTAPVELTSPPGDARQFVVEQSGRIRIIQNGALVATPFLDLTSSVLYSGERGLLSVAFHPNYATNGYLYVNYVGADNNTHIERFKVSAGNANVADVASRTPILTVTQTSAPNHKGGLNSFGPDGYLYIGMGESATSSNAQLMTTMLGKMLRIDVDHTDPGKAYAVPSTNPFVGQSGTPPEIWATGLRNPWRYSFDAPSGKLYLADVGEGTYEEVNVVDANQGGLNFGWNIMEGANCFGASTCAQGGLTLPVVTYTHADGCAVVGGYVYRGSAIPELVGHYFYGDYCNGWVRSFSYANGTVSNQQRWTSFGSIGSILSFGRDASGELYVLSANGTVYRIDKN